MFLYRSVGQLPVSNDDKTDRLIYMQFKDYNHEMFDFVVLYRYLFMWLNYSLLTYGTSEGIIAVIDSKGLSWRHIVKLPVVISTKMLKFLEVRQSLKILTTPCRVSRVPEIVAAIPRPYQFGVTGRRGLFPFGSRVSVSPVYLCGRSGQANVKLGPRAYLRGDTSLPRVK